MQLANAPTYLVPLGLKQWFVDVGIDPAKVIELDWWQTFRTDRVTFTATPSQHWSGRGLFDREQTLWAAWHIDIEDFSVWFAGDTGYNDFQFKAVAERWGGVDLALIPIGSYAPRWFMQKHHVNPEEAIRIHQDVNARLSIGMHWGTFQLSAEPMMEPRQRLQQLIAENGLSRGEFVTLAIGESITLNGRG